MVSVPRAELNIGINNRGAINNTSQKRNATQPSFTGRADRIREMLPSAKTLAKFQALKKFKGDFGGIIITALGTGLVAPIFIGFNPFTRAPKDATPEQKEDLSNKKKYTAMRQPISAIVAICLQTPVQKYIDRGLDAIFHSDSLAKQASITMDQRVINSKTFIENQTKSEFKKQGLKKPSLIATLFSKDAKQKRKEYTAKLEAEIKAKQEKQINDVALQFAKDNEIKIKERHLPLNTTAELINSQIDDYIKDAQKLKKSADAQIPRYLDRADLLYNNKDTFNEIFTPIINNKKVTEEELNTLIAQNKNNPEVQIILKEILGLPEDLRVRKIERTLERIDKINKACGGTYSRDAYRQALLNRNTELESVISQLSECRIKDTTAADKNAIAKAIDAIANACNIKDKDTDLRKSVLKDTETFGVDLDALKAKVCKDVVKKYKELIKHTNESWNQITKMGVGVFITVPLTCTVLNWIYPRFMDIFFPELAGAKKKHCGHHNEKTGGDK